MSSTYFLYFKSQNELNYDIFVDPNILGASRLIHSDLENYGVSFFRLDINTHLMHVINPLTAKLYQSISNLGTQCHLAIFFEF